MQVFLIKYLPKEEFKMKLIQCNPHQKVPGIYKWTLKSITFHMSITGLQAWL